MFYVLCSMFYVVCILKRALHTMQTTPSLLKRGLCVCVYVCVCVCFRSVFNGAGARQFRGGLGQNDSHSAGLLCMCVCVVCVSYVCVSVSCVCVSLVYAFMHTVVCRWINVLGVDGLMFWV